MTAEVRTVRTAAEQAIVEHFERVLPSLPGGPRVRAAREAAFALFRKNGLPHRRVEEWKYTDLRALMRKALPPAERPTEAAARSALQASRDPLGSLDRYRLVVVDGYYFEELSDTAALRSAGVEVGSVAESMTRNDHPFDTPRLAGTDIAAALNQAFVTDGVFVAVPADSVLGRPLEILNLSTKGGHAITVRSSVFVGVGAKAKIIETYAGPNAADYQVNAGVSVVAAGRAEVAYARVQVEGDESIHLDSAEVGVMPGATFDHLAVTVGAAISRSQVFLSTGGDNTRVGLWGATMIKARQHADSTLVIDHLIGGAGTRVLYKGAIDGEANGIFQGKLIVARDAQKTDAKMTSRALLLSENAQFSAKPELEIYADDVQCGHGATSGQIDPNELFYLMARGIPRNEAERLLVEAFLYDAVERLGDGAIGAPLKALASGWLAKRGGAA